MNTITSITPELGAFCAALTTQDIPSDALHKLKLCILDCVGTMIAGTASEPMSALEALLRRSGQGDGEAVVPGTDRTLSAPAAALLNSASAEMYELQDGWRFGNDHPSVCIPAALAAASSRPVGGHEFLAAVCAGYEVTNRLAWTVHPHHLAKGFLPTGTVGTCGAAAAAGKLMGLDADSLAGALSNAAFLAPLSVAETLWAGHSAKPLHSGWAARTGLECAHLARSGFESCPIEGTPGRGKGMLEITTGTAHLGRALERLGSHFTVADVYFKIYPACRHAHGTAEACLAIADDPRFRVDDLERIEVFTYQLAADLLDRQVIAKGSSTAAQFSIPYIAAVSLLDGMFDVPQTTPVRISAGDVQALQQRVTVRSDLELTDRYPEVTPTRVVAHLRGHPPIAASVEMPKGDPRRPLSEPELFEKFRRLASLRLTSAQSDRLIESIMHIETQSNVCELMRIQPD